MKSATLSDVPTTLVADAGGFPSLPQTERSGQAFGALLSEATSEQKTSEVDSDSLDLAAPEESDSKKKKVDDSTIVSLFCFCPPPKVEQLTPESVQGEAKCDLAELTSVDSEAAPPPTAEAARPGEQKLTDLVAPKGSEPQTSRESKGVELDLGVFQPVLEDKKALDVANSDSAKAPEIRKATVESAVRGTLVAQLENRVKNTEKPAEITPAIEQKMPVREVFRRTVAELGRVESFQADNHPSHLLTADFDIGPAEVIPVKALQAVHLVETIRTEVSSLRQRNETTMTVVLRPDSGTQLALDVSIARDGTVHAQARCERGDFQSLQAQWPQLQQSLAAHGIRIADLANQNQPQQQPEHRSPEGSFDRGQNPQQREQRDLSSFEEQFSASKNKLSAGKQQPQPATRASTPRRWQSWA